jgi:hypothetical protein
MSSNRVLSASVLAFASFAATAAAAQSQGYDNFRRETARAVTAKQADESEGADVKTSLRPESEYHFTSRSDSLDWVRGKRLADESSGFRVIVSLQDRHVWAVSDEDTLLSAPAAVAKGTSLSYAGQDYTFKTPRGIRTVLDKSADPIWQPPNWLYVETAEENDLHVKYIPSSGYIKASDGRKITVRDNVVGVLDDNDGFLAFPTNLHIIVGNDLFVPPMGTENRRVAGTLGKYKLNLGDGYMLHGTPDQNSIGLAATHGCVRLRDEDIEWLYENVPVGARVYIY